VIQIYLPMRNPSQSKVGILGGGQLGRMLLQAAANYPVETHVLENDDDCPAAYLCRYFVKGSITDYGTVYNFGKHLDALTIEIENVNVEALEALEAEGKKIFPKPSVLRIIKNKILQKQYYAQHQVPSAAFEITQTREDVQRLAHLLPAVHKLAEGGYDGRGVQVIRDNSQLQLAFDAPGVL
jgi:5-(carboxyamino)imidazole ribonucleotide synthase